jgi:hypothetical protein
MLFIIVDYLILELYRILKLSDLNKIGEDVSKLKLKYFSGTTEN